MFFGCAIGFATSVSTFPIDYVPVENRIKMFRLVEKMAMESINTISDIHGGGSPAALRMTIFRESDLDYKKGYAKRLAGIE